MRSYGIVAIESLHGAQSVNIGQLLRDRDAQLLREPGNHADANRRLVHQLALLTESSTEERVVWHPLTTALYNDGLTSNLLYFASVGATTLHFAMNLFADPSAMDGCETPPVCFNFSLSIIHEGQMIAFGDGMVDIDDEECFDEDDPQGAVIADSRFVSTEHLSDLFSAISVSLGEMTDPDVVTEVRRGVLLGEYMKTGEHPFDGAEPIRDGNGVLVLAWQGEGYDYPH